MNLLPSLNDGHLHALSFDMLQETFFRNFYFTLNSPVNSPSWSSSLMTAANFLAQIIALAQVCSGFSLKIICHMKQKNKV